MTRTCRFAIIGIGSIAPLHARAVRDLKNAELVGGSCRGEKKGRGFAEAFSCRWYTDHLEMLDREKPDAAIICTPNGAHLEPALDCIRRGIHVLCEKPLEVTTARVDQMIAAARQAGVVLGGIFPLRYGGVLQAVHAAAAAGRFGSLAVASAYAPWWRDDAYYGPTHWQGDMKLGGGGVMMSQAIHAIDALQWLAAAAIPGLSPEQNPVAEVFAFTAKRGHDPVALQVEDTGVACFRYRNGALGQLLGSTGAWPGTLQRFQLGGRDGTAEVVQDGLTKFEFRSPLPDDQATREKFAPKPPVEGGPPKPMATSYDRHLANVADFLRAIEEGRTPDIDGLQARKAVAIVEAIYESAETGKAVAPR